MTETTQTQSNKQWYGAIAHTEFGSTDTKATTDFLTKVFGMNWEAQDGPMEYHMAYVEGQPSCAVRPVMPEEPGPSQTPFINVPDIDGTITLCNANGGKVIVPKTAVPGMGYFAWVQIPGGPTVSAWQQDSNAA